MSRPISRPSAPSRSSCRCARATTGWRPRAELKPGASAYALPRLLIRRRRDVRIARRRWQAVTRLRDIRALMVARLGARPGIAAIGIARAERRLARRLNGAVGGRHRLSNLRESRRGQQSGAKSRRDYPFPGHGIVPPWIEAD